MSLQSIYGVTGSSTVSTVNTKKEEVKNDAAATENKTGFDDTAVVYEKSPTPDTTITNKNSVVDHEAIIAQMKADAEARMNQMNSYVQQMMNQQGIAIGTADDIWSFLASGDYTVTEAAKLKAQEAISEDGYWGVEQTSQRIVDFAKALAGGDVNYADELLEAFKEGYAQATSTWGKDLPDISKQTYDAVEEKFAAWKAEASKDTTEDTTVEDTTTKDPETTVPSTEDVEG